MAVGDLVKSTLGPKVTLSFKYFFAKMSCIDALEVIRKIYNITSIILEAIF